MGLFDRLYYGKAGKRDYSEMDMPKNRVSLFFMVLKDHVFDLVKVNLLQVVFWIPFLLWTYINLAAVQSIDTETVLAAEGGAAELMSAISGYVMMWLIGLIPCIAITGPSSAGAAYIMRNWARDQHAFLFSDYKDAFKSNWKQALAVSAITSVVPVVAYTASSYYGNLAKGNALLLIPLMVVFSATLMFALMLPLLYPMMVGYELSFKNLMKNAFLMSAARLPNMLLARTDYADSGRCAGVRHLYGQWHRDSHRFAVLSAVRLCALPSDLCVLCERRVRQVSQSAYRGRAGRSGSASADG